MPLHAVFVWGISVLVISIILFACTKFQVGPFSDSPPYFGSSASVSIPTGPTGSTPFPLLPPTRKCPNGFKITTVTTVTTVTKPDGKKPKMYRWACVPDAKCPQQPPVKNAIQCNGIRDDVLANMCDSVRNSLTAE